MAENLGSPQRSYILTREARNRLDEQAFPRLLEKNRSRYGELLHQVVLVRARLWAETKAEVIEMEDVFASLALLLADEDNFNRHMQAASIGPRGTDLWDAYLNWYTWLVIKSLWQERFTFK